MSGHQYRLKIEASGASFIDVTLQVYLSSRSDWKLFNYIELPKEFNRDVMLGRMQFHMIIPAMAYQYLYIQGCPQYGGYYAIYVSDDNGETWTLETSHDHQLPAIT